MTATAAVTRVEEPAQTGSSFAIRTTDLTRRFGDHVAVNSVSLSVPRGAVYGFLGPNGSGKTTTIRLLLGLMQANSGSVEMLGEQMPRRSAAVLPRVGTLVEGPAFYPYLSGRSNLRRLDAFDATSDRRTSNARIDAALDRVGLTAAAGKNYRRYSLGMKQRLGLAAALLQPRDLLILDEPTNGLDPQGTREVRTLIRDLAADGSTVLVSSHLLAEIEQVATHVGIMSAGTLLKQGTLAEVLSGTAALLRVDTTAISQAIGVLEQLGLSIDHIAPDYVTAKIGDVPAEKVNAALVHAGVPVRGLALQQPALEDMFVELTGKGYDVVR